MSQFLVLFKPRGVKIRSVFSHKKFEFKEMHLHWNPSEHTVNDNLYAAELHMVHVDESHGDVAVMALLFQVFFSQIFS